MIEKISKDSTYKPVSTLEYMSSGNRLYFKNNCITNTNENLVLPSSSQPEDEEDIISTNSNPIGMKTVQISIFPIEPGSNSRKTIMEEIQTSTIDKKSKVGINIKVTFQFRKYKNSLNAMIDTGATISSCRRNAVPVEK
uniref:Uncharacterized protein n=1 Tax=Gossypium raimondii TaxID=29730 RepID=A0A0D2V1H3_GOSRA|nr:hypothetical protein B456_012G040200 [Gossypium raimondii]